MSMLGVFLFSGLPPLLQKRRAGFQIWGESIGEEEGRKRRREEREEEVEHVKKPQLVGALERRAFFAKKIF